MYPAHILANSLLTDFAQVLQKVADSGAGAFGFGAIFAGIFAHFMYKLASQERIARDKHDRDRETELLKQLENKDKRIDALHEELLKARKAKP